jgi:hypothetical protein
LATHETCNKSAFIHLRAILIGHVTRSNQLFKAKRAVSGATENKDYRQSS